MNKMTHEEYVQKQRQKICSLATKMLEGSIDYLEGSIEICSLRSELDLPNNDEDISAFVFISSETDHLPIGSVRAHWSKEALLRLEPEIESATQWAKETSFKNCRSLVVRFSG
jgi:hypothetical protein